MAIPEELKVYLKKEELFEEQILQNFIENLKTSYTFTFTVQSTTLLNIDFNIKDFEKNNKKEVIIKTSDLLLKEGIKLSTLNIVDIFLYEELALFKEILTIELRNFKLPTILSDIVINQKNNKTGQSFQFFNSKDFIIAIENYYKEYSVQFFLNSQKLSTVLKALF